MEGKIFVHRNGGGEIIVHNAAMNHESEPLTQAGPPPPPPPEGPSRWPKATSPPQVLEVGARRAPYLLEYKYSAFSITHGVNYDWIL